MKKIILTVMAIIIIAGGIGGYFVFRNNSAPVPPAGVSPCGDNVCDEFEKANPNICPADCVVKNTEDESKISYKCSQCNSLASSFNADKKEDESKTSYKCPQYAPPAPSFYKNCEKQGGSVKAGRKNDKGCQTRPQCILPKETTKSGKAVSGYFDSPFGFAAVVDNDIDTYKKDLGFSSMRLSAFDGIIWESNDPNMNGNYVWQNDSIFRQISQSGLELSVIVSPGRKDSGGNWKSPISLNKLNEFSGFIKAAVERYDSDGVDDAQGRPKITYWELDNEMDLYEEFGGGEKTPWKGWDSKNNKEVVEGETLEYAKLLKSFYAAVKSADPGAKVVIGGLASSTAYYGKIFENLKALKDNPGDRFFDVFNYHSYGPYQTYGQATYSSSTMQGGASVKEIKNLLNKYGYGNIETIITETGTWSGVMPREGAQTETQHASNLIKRYIYSIAHGVSRVYWTNLKAKDGDIFGMGGLVENGNKKLAYYAYKLMVKKLSSFDRSNIHIVQEKNGVYVYKFLKNGKPIWVAWNDNGAEKQITISDVNSPSVKITEAVPNYDSGKDVIDYSNAFSIKTANVENGEVTIKIKDVPVFAEED